MRRLLIQPQARVDLLEIWHYVARDSIANANRVGEKLGDAIRGLTVVPGKGHSRADVRDPRIRFWSVYSFVIAYRYDDRTVTVVRVVHGRRNFRNVFKR